MLLYAVVLITFGVYIRSINLMLLHDDVINALWMRNYTPLSIFAPITFGGAWARPLANALWLGVRAGWGRFDPVIIHALNVWFHVLCTALVGQLAQHLARRLVATGRFVWAGGVAAAIFGLFPFSFQTILWAGAIYHPLMVACGLLAIWLSLKAPAHASAHIQWLGVALALALCDLSHDVGFQFAVLLLWLHLMLAWIERRRPDWPLLGIGLGAVVLALLYRAWLQQSASTVAPITIQSPADSLKNWVIFAQGWVYWLVIPLRQWLGLTEQASMWIAGLFMVSVLLGGLLLPRRVLLLLVGGWLILSMPAVLLLDEAYVRFGPRLLYASAVSVAWFWAFLATVLLHVRRPMLRRGWQIAVPSVLFVVSVWSIRYIGIRMRETERLTPGLRVLVDQVAHVPGDSTILLINLPWWNAPSNPSFWVGAEGLPLFQHLGAPAWTWAGMQTGYYGVERATDYVTHSPSRGQSADWVYGTPGDALDDAALRTRIFQDADLNRTRYIDRFVYDAPGVRMQPLAVLQPSGMDLTALSLLYDGPDTVRLGNGSARRCGAFVQLHLSWVITSALKSDLAVFVHGVNAAGEQVLVADADPVGGYLPLNQWLAPISIQETREIRVPSNIHDLTAIQVGVYRRDNGQRLVAKRADGARLDGDALQIQLEDGTTTNMCQ